MNEFNARERLASAQSLVNEARTYPAPEGLPKTTKYKSRHNIAHEAIVLLIGPLRYTSMKGILTTEERRKYESLLEEAKMLRGY